MKIIPLSQGLFALVSDGDFEYLSQWKWYAARRSGNTFYARRMETKNGKRKLIYMHRAVTKCPDGLEPDHINHNTLDNRRENLRVCTHYENVQNAIHPFGKTSKGFRGVRLFDGKWWRAQISIAGKAIHLGTFPTAEEAARAYDKANKEHRGKNARLNFSE
jgi:hypothetical protein